MNDKNNRELTKYYKEIADGIQSGGNQKTLFLCDFEDCVEDYISEHPDCTAEEIRLHFGSSEDIAKGFCEASSVAEPSRNNITKYLLIGIAAAVLIWLVFAVISLIDVHSEAHGTLTEGILALGTAAEAFL